MSPDEQMLFEQSLTDLDVFISGFQKQAAGPNGERFIEPLERLKLIKKNLLKLRKKSTKRHKKTSDTDSSMILDRIEQTSQSNLQILRADLQSISSSTNNLKQSLKRMEALEKQLLSIGQSTMDAAGQIGGLVKKLQKQVTNQDDADGGNSAALQTLSDSLDAKFRDFQTKMIGMARNLNSVDRRVKDETDLIVDLTETVEKGFTGVKEQLSQISGGQAPAPAPAAASEAPAKSSESENTALLNRIADRISAIDSLSMVLHPLSNSYQQLSIALQESPSWYAEGQQAILAELQAIRKAVESSTTDEQADDKQSSDASDKSD